MRIRKLSQINKKYIQDSVEVLVSKKIYYNEAQLQFDLAWKIRESLGKKSKLVVCLEKLTATGRNHNSKKHINLYTDIVILNKKTNEFIPIELKYKTKEDVKLGLKSHGAYDFGCYDFLWDTRRNEMLRNSTISKLTLNSKVEKEIQRTKQLLKFIKGYSIIITNDEIYWKNKEDSNSCAKDFFLDDKKIIPKGQMLNWLSSAKFYKNTWRDMPLSFDKEYECKWFSIGNTNIQTIKGLIFETT